jgi:hypothetical protein
MACRVLDAVTVRRLLHLQCGEKQQQAARQGADEARLLTV